MQRLSRQHYTPQKTINRKPHNQLKTIGKDYSFHEGDSMTTLLILIPWVLTVGALLFIMVQSRRNAENYDEEDDMFFGEGEEEREIVRVAVYEDRAYWVHDGVFYESDVTREPDFTTARPIDTMELPQKELERLFTILDELENHNERD